jgi:hypothetical protein
MLNWLFRIIGEPTILKFVMILVCSSVIYLTVASLIINFIDWVQNIYYSTKLGWFQLSYPNYKDKIVKMKFDIYIVGYPSGEVFYVDRKRILKLKDKRLIEWDSEISRYIFKDRKVEMVKKVISPMIVNYIPRYTN